MAQVQGLIINSHGRHFNVEHQSKIYQSTAKGKKTEYVVGDEVLIDIINNDQASITDLVPRKNLIYRSDHYRSKIIASNLSQLLIVVAIKPNFNIGFLDKVAFGKEPNHFALVIHHADAVAVAVEGQAQVGAAARTAATRTRVRRGVRADEILLGFQERRNGVLNPLNLAVVANGAPGTAGDLVLQDGDQLLIPKRSQEVTVIGEVQNATSHLFQPGLARDDYVSLSGGTTRRADDRRRVPQRQRH